jgi:hypothetical protein
MKKAALRIAFIAFVAIAIAESANATVTMSFKVDIQYDNCSPSGTTGNYAVYCELYAGQNLLCSGYQVNLKNGSVAQPVTYDCNIEEYEHNCTYTFRITICRYPSGTCCYTNADFTNVCWSWLTDGTHFFNIHVQ